jgi:DNA-binding CsgD family transcriptional regulator
MEGTVQETQSQMLDTGSIKLNDREIEILRLIFDGKCSSEAASTLSVSKRTIDFHMARAYIKLGVTNRFQAFQKAVELGIISF